MPEKPPADGTGVGLRAAGRISLPAALLLAAMLGPLVSAPALSDEIFTLEAASKPWPQLWEALEADVHPPLHYILVKGWFALVGASVESLRTFSLLMALTGVFLAALLIPSSPEISRWAAWFSPPTESCS